MHFLITRFLSIVSIGTFVVFASSCASDPNLRPDVASNTVKEPSAKRYTRGEPFPDLSGRDVALVPGPIPDRVRFVFADNAEVSSLAGTLKAALDTADDSIVGDTLMIQPWAWSEFKRDPILAKLPGITLGMLNAGPSSGPTGEAVSGKILRGSAASAKVLDRIRETLRNEGGYDIRSLKTEEMAKWWIYIGFDIEEPVYVVESKNQAHRYVLAFVKGKLFIVDELNALP